jgi:glycolate oxidase
MDDVGGVEGRLKRLSGDLEGIVGKDHVRTDIYTRASYASGALPYDLVKEDLPDVVVQPRDADEVSRVVRYANKNRIPVAVHGSGTSLIDSTRPKCQGIALSTRRLDSMEISEDYMWFECGAGHTIKDAMEELAKVGYFLPINTGSKIVATVGGAVAVNTIGHLTDNIYGKPINNVLGLEVVLPEGEIINTGTKSLRKPAGLDLTRFFVGSEGLFGIITKIRMVLIAKPQTLDIVAFFQKSEDVGYAVSSLYRSGLPLPLDGEFVGEKGARLGCNAKGLDFPEGAMLIARVVGRTSDEASNNAVELCEFLNAQGAIESYTLENDKTREEVWSIRENVMAFGAELGLRGILLIEVNPALPYLADAIADLRQIPEEYGLLKEGELYLYGHLGACSLHAQFAFPYDWPNQKMKMAIREAWEFEEELNIKYEGCGGEWGQSAYRIPFVRKRWGEAGYAMLRRLKEAFDPNNILNPGNLEGDV